MRERRTYTDEEKTQALALLLDGVSQVDVETRLDIPQQTISRWRTEWVESGTEISEQLKNAEMRIAHRVDILIERKLDRIEAGKCETCGHSEDEPSMPQAAVIAGIYRTKAKERQETDHKHPPTINFEQAVFIIKKGD